MRKLYVNCKLHPVTFDIMFIDSNTGEMQRLEPQSALNLNTLIDYLMDMILKNDIDEVNTIGTELTYQLQSKLYFHGKRDIVNLLNLKSWNLKR